MSPCYKVICYCISTFLVFTSCTLDQDLITSVQESDSEIPLPPITLTTVGSTTENETNSTENKILVFTKTAGFKHSSIGDGLQLLTSLGTTNNFQVDQTEDALNFNDTTLAKYQLVIFLNTTGDILDDSQQMAFENYIQNGGSYMGIHAASDTEYDWPWYGQLVGAYFESHPDIQNGDIQVLDNNHSATEHLSSIWTRTDEWYNFRDINANLNVLLNLDETSYQGGTNGENHPIAWYHEFDGGRSFYTGGGHTSESYDEPDFQKHLLGGILYCLGRD